MFAFILFVYCFSIIHILSFPLPSSHTLSFSHSLSPFLSHTLPSSHTTHTHTPSPIHTHHTYTRTHSVERGDPQWLADGTLSLLNSIKNISFFGDIKWVQDNLVPGTQLGPLFYAPLLTSIVTPPFLNFLVGTYVRLPHVPFFVLNKGTGTFISDMFLLLPHFIMESVVASLFSFPLSFSCITI